MAFFFGWVLSMFGCYFVYILDGTTVENKGKLILTEIFPSVQKHDIYLQLMCRRGSLHNFLACCCSNALYRRAVTPSRASRLPSHALVMQIHSPGKTTLLQKITEITTSLKSSRICMIIFIIIFKVINTFKYHVFAPMVRFQLELIYLYFPPSFHQTVAQARRQK